MYFFFNWVKGDNIVLGKLNSHTEDVKGVLIFLSFQFWFVNFVIFLAHREIVNTSSHKIFDCFIGHYYIQIILKFDIIWIMSQLKKMQKVFYIFCNSNFLEITGSNSYFDVS